MFAVGDTVEVLRTVSNRHYKGCIGKVVDLGTYKVYVGMKIPAFNNGYYEVPIDARYLRKVETKYS